MENLKKFRQMAGLTQFKLSRKARVSRSKIADAETGRAEFSEQEADRIIDALAAGLKASLVEINHLLNRPAAQQSLAEPNRP